MKLLVAATIAASMVLPLSSFAEDAKTLQVKQSIDIKAESAAVWAKVSNFNDMGAWHPAVKKTEIVSGKNNEKNAVRVLTLQDGGTIKEKLHNYDAKKQSFKYEILEGVLPVSKYVSTLSVAPTKAGVTTVTWESSFKRKDLSKMPAKGQTDEDATNTINGVYKGGLDNLKKISEAK